MNTLTHTCRVVYSTRTASIHFYISLYKLQRTTLLSGRMRMLGVLFHQSKSVISGKFSWPHALPQVRSRPYPHRLCLIHPPYLCTSSLSSTLTLPTFSSHLPSFVVISSSHTPSLPIYTYSVSLPQSSLISVSTTYKDLSPTPSPLASPLPPLLPRPLSSYTSKI